jgi:hypothetical protein
VCFVHHPVVSHSLNKGQHVACFLCMLLLSYEDRIALQKARFVLGSL